MSDPAERAIVKLKTIRNMSDDKEVRMLADTMIEYINDKEKPEAGFVPGGKS